MGAKKLAIINVGLIGCIPPPPNNGGCDQTLNDRAIAFNAALKTLMAGIASKKPDFSYSIGNYHDFTVAVFANPADYGMVNMGSCNKWGYPDEYWLWDPEFMTDKAAKLTAAAFYYGPP
ncbi:GDSL esterase/lipase [Hordeum vulgare]|nr:GDSL esterase/lipase [Hordeum vulgare]